MKKADLHVHSEHSEHPSEWFLQRIGARESYTDVEEVYRQARGRGMDYVTITDHNSIAGALELCRRHPDDTFISAEVTSYFPEDGCKVHVLVYGITPIQFDIIQQRRNNVYALRDYLRGEDIACSVAHAGYSVNRRLTRDTLEKLILLFDVFEGINGARGRTHNATWTGILGALTPADLQKMSKRHGIEPWGDDSWVKGLTGGSDDHAGLYVGRTHTEARAASIPDFLSAIRRRKSRAGGETGSHKALSFAIYKIACDFSKRQGGGSGVLGMINNLVFDEGKAGLRERLVRYKLGKGTDSRTRALKKFFDAIAEGRALDSLDVEARLDSVYRSLTGLTDDFFAMVATSLEKDLRSGQADRLLKNLSAALPAAFVLVPFFSTMRHLHQQSRKLLDEMRDSLANCPEAGERKLLWFSDTVTDLNGVAVTMRQLAACAARTGRAMKVVTSLPEEEAASAALPRTVINLPCVYAVTPDFYTSFTLRLPSILSALDVIAEEDPSEIVVSTPGPVGLLGLLAARLLGVKCTGVYHTDFTRQADLFVGDEWVSEMIEAYTRWFFREMDEIRVPTEEYKRILAERGLDPARMRLFRRGIEPGFAVNSPARQAALRKKLGIPEDATVFMWAGRLGKEKNLDFLMEVYRRVAARRDSTVLLMVGDGPELRRLQSETPAGGRVIFTGRVERRALPHLYHLAHAFVFPSTTDTFGMVVLESLACGLPAIVSDVGGPQELVRSGETGFVVPADDAQAWESALLGLVDLKERDGEVLDAMRRQAREHTRGGHGWEQVLDEMMGATIDMPGRTEAPSDPRKAALAAAV